MAIQREFYGERSDGVKLYRTFSDDGKFIVQTETGAVLEDAVDVKDADGLEEAIRSLLSDPEMAKRMGDAGRTFVEENFEQKTFIKKYMENRKSLLGLTQTHLAD